MKLSVKNSALVVKEFGRNTYLTIANMTQKINDRNNKQIIIKTVMPSTKPRTFYFPLSEIKYPIFADYDALKLWFDENVVLTYGITQGDLDNVYNNIDGGSFSSVYLPHQKIDGGTL